MLVLSRKAGQTIEIGDNITITVTKVGGNQVRIGIDAPMEMPIRRGELQVHRDSSEPDPDAIIRLAQCLTVNPAAPIQAAG